MVYFNVPRTRAFVGGLGVDDVVGIAPSTIPFQSASHLEFGTGRVQAEQTIVTCSTIVWKGKTKIIRISTTRSNSPFELTLAYEVFCRLHNCFIIAAKKSGAKG